LINADIPVDHYFIKGVLTRLRNRGYLILRTKCNILVDKAARLLGIVDDYNVLEENEIYASYSLDKNEKIAIIGVGID
jgi:RNA-dependent RNA polymerase